MECIYRNGDITGYSVRYGEMGSDERTVEMVSGAFSGGMLTISGLSLASVYTVEVAAETSAGTGPYSVPLTFETLESELVYINFKVYRFF